MQSLTIDFTDIDQLRRIIQNYIYSDSAEYQKMKRRAEEGFSYYGNEDKIKLTGAAAIDEVNRYLRLIGSNPLHSADNRVSTNRHRVVVDQKVGYLFTAPPQFDMAADDSNAGDDALLKSIKDTTGMQWTKVIRQLGTDCSNTGRAWLAYWRDNSTDNFDYWYVNPLTCVPIYDRSTIKKKLLYLIRIYGYNDNDGRPATRYEIWSDTQVAYLIRANGTATKTEPAVNYEILPNGSWNIQQHAYGRVPFIEFRNNAKALPDLIMYKDFIDALDKLISGFANDIDDIQEIIWVIKNYRGDENAPVYDKDGNEVLDDHGDPIQRPVDRLKMMKAKKIIDVGDDGGVDTLKNEIPYEARKALREILDDEFWVAAMAVNPKPDTAGNQSGVYIDFLYGLLELKSGLLETEFRASINDFLQAILRYLGADESKQFTQTWKRTKPQNNTEISAIIAQTPNTVVSDETKTKAHPLVTDWQAERAQINKEQQKIEEQRRELFGNDDVPPETPPGSGSPEGDA
ncbi:phage portal protein, SPP1 family [Sporobacter termitidis DSM 10068]|uniref:Phage portal protein, SPP1 family n=1 Tax=Sporobacter termitidis DSM 10068 TaxID=1123282 RepID=A0A1M5ZJJ8_9FIRM|nr:phage portal protein [Sporobacter termitidis]SHI24334.1 phage portal protein, SPP1 family [Sporobacter termitidis DSM 10068]SHI24587.1 phage portal protein, SPP1 family [Sporobacter termitidis DSM 10068]